MAYTSSVVGENWMSWNSAFWNTTLPGAVATSTPTSKRAASVCATDSLPPPRAMSAAKAWAPRSRLSPPVAAASRRAAGLVRR